jgi:lipoprotein-anchoring transpeptidase ErfK/SrfK
VSRSSLHVAALACLALFSVLAAHPPPAHAGVVARVSVSGQSMDVVVDGRTVHRWKVSTGAGRARTPTGTFRPLRMHRHYRSQKYGNAPMPHAIFFHKGYAIHGTYQTGRLGRPASKGCVRLHPQSAAVLFELVRARGPGNTRIVIVP